LSVTSSSTAGPKIGSEKRPAATSGSYSVPNSAPKRPRAVVLRQRQHARARRAALPEDLDIGVAEAVDGLKLVADEEDLVTRHQVDKLALKAVRILELVHENRAEAPARVVADLLVQLQKGAGMQLQVLEVERRLACLRLAVGSVEFTQELLEEKAVAGSDLVQGRLLDGRQRLSERGEAHPLLPAHAEIGEIEEILGGRDGVEEL
jgi:hypothetical protein